MPQLIAQQANYSKCFTNLEKIENGKHSSLFAWSIGDEEERVVQSCKTCY
jgi:hypothetical protein